MRCAVIWLACFGGGCATIDDPVLQVVNEAGFVTTVVRADPFDHVVFASHRQRGALLHIYIGSDGTPWTEGVRPASDPTPRNPLTLRLMAADPQTSIFLGRPCYFGLNHQAGCDADIWTHGRYSSLVLDSMADALAQALLPFGATPLVLIGYSGGAVLATLLAQRLPRVLALVTIAGNLDIELWSLSRGFLALENSLNPASIETFRADLLQFHLVGEQDRIVPNAVTQSFTDRHGGLLWSYPRFDHRCCWEKQWPEILDRIALAIAAHRDIASE